MTEAMIFWCKIFGMGKGGSAMKWHEMEYLVVVVVVYATTDPFARIIHVATEANAKQSDLIKQDFFLFIVLVCTLVA
jgi:hypothetical protein